MLGKKVIYLLMVLLLSLNFTPIMAQASAEPELQGTITDEYGIPIKGIRIEVFTYYFAATLKPLAEAITDENGHYSIAYFDRNERAGFQGVRFSIKGYQVYRSLGLYGPHTFNFQFPEVLNTASGTITLENVGIPVPNQTVTYDKCVSTSLCVPLGSAVTDSSGNFLISFIDTDYGMLPYVGGINVFNHDPFKIGRTQIPGPPPEGTLYGIAPHGGGVTVQLVDVGTTQTNELGGFGFFNLADKDYTLIASAAGFETTTMIVRPSSSPLTVRLSPSYSYDKMAPTTTLSSSTIDGLSGWYKTNPTITLNAADDMSGVAQTFYRINGGSWQNYTAPFKVTTEGTSTIEYYSTDKAGNIEAIKSYSLKVDITAPITKSILSPINGLTKSGKSYIKGYTATLTATDNQSTVTRTVYSINHSSYQPYTGPFDFYANDTTHLQYFTVDGAGNRETPNVYDFVTGVFTGNK
jgi:hypothetical protein